jgi:tRNA pseudouridine55 synthase
VASLCKDPAVSSSPLFGVLNLNKPAGITSRDLVNKVQRLVRPTKVGHAGTLDPMATGVLLVCVGPATRLVSMLQEGRKTYVTQFTLGQTSDTDDSSGVIAHRAIDGPPPLLPQIVELLNLMTGVISQVPPDYSAVHVDGQRAYSLARQGQEISLKAKEIEIHSIQLLRYEWPLLELEIVCGSGTYIRSIARDLGEQLGCGGLMSRLERTRIGDFSVSQSLTVDELTQDNLPVHVCPAVQIVQALPKFDCTPEDVTNLLCGRRLVVCSEQMESPEPLSIGQSVAITRNGFQELLALAEFTTEGNLQPRTVFMKIEPR